LILDERRIVVKGLSLKVTRKLEKATSYLVAGFMFTPAFKRKKWDGREHLMKFKSGVGHVIPIGLLGEVRACLDENGVKYKVQRRKRPPMKRISFEWNESIKLRPYQRKAVKAFCSAPERGRGILKMPIRSGKTKTSAAVIRRLGARTLFFVPSKMLLHQTAESLQEALPNARIGKIGDGNWTEGEHVTVATIQSVIRLRGGTKRQCPGNKLRDDSGRWVKDTYTEAVAACGKKRCQGAHNYMTKRDPRYDALMTSYDLAIFDECHHLRDGIWHHAMLDCHALYRLGLSATVFLDCDKENEQGIIYLRACTGAIRFEVSMSDLIEKGYLMRQHVEMYTCKRPIRSGWDESTFKICINENRRRNLKIVKIVEQKVRRGMNVLIVTNRLTQIQMISQMLEGARLSHEIITGSDGTDARDNKVQMFTSGHVPILIGTVFAEGIDIPEVECVVNAQGGRDAKATIQRMRNMTPSEGKTKCVLVDFMDLTNEYLQKHSEERLATYEAESAFMITKKWEKKALDSDASTR